MSADDKSNPARIQCLQSFRKPTDRYEFLKRRYFPEPLQRNPAEVLDQLVAEGLLVPAPLGDAIARQYTKPPIEEVLEKRNLSKSGTKPQIIRRLIEHDREAAEAMLEGREFLVCSPEAAAMVDAHLEKRHERREAAKQETFAALMRGKDKEAYKIRVDFKPAYSHADHGFYVDTEEMAHLLFDEPAFFTKVGDEHKQSLRAAAAMAYFWRGEKPGQWLPDDFASEFEDNEIAVNLLTEYAKIQQRLDHYDEDEYLELTFNRYDLDSCAKCRAFENRIVQKKELPEFPAIDCTSDKGCQFQITPHWDMKWEQRRAQSESRAASGSPDVEELDPAALDVVEQLIGKAVDRYMKEHIEAKSDPLLKLRQLKQMLDEDLITAADYESAKEQVLAGLGPNASWVRLSQRDLNVTERDELGVQEVGNKRPRREGEGPRAHDAPVIDLVPGEFAHYLQQVQEQGGGGNFVISSAHRAPTCFMQFAWAKGDAWVYAEASIRGIQDRSGRLNEEKAAQLEAMGWTPPSDTASNDASPNFHRYYDVPDSSARLAVAEDAVEVFKQVYVLNDDGKIIVELNLE